MIWQIAVCEDERFFRERLKRELLSWEASSGEKIKIHEYLSADLLYEAWDGGARFDAFFLDIETHSELSGLTLAEKIRAKEPTVPFVFVTAIEKHWPQGFALAAVDYLIKDKEASSFASVMERLLLRMQQSRTAFFTFYIGRMEHKMPQSELFCLVSDTHYLLLNDDPALRTRMNFEEAFLQLSPNFVRASRSVAVNLEYVEAFHRTKVRLHVPGMAPVAIGEAYQESFHKAYRDYNRNYTTSRSPKGR